MNPTQEEKVIDLLFASYLVLGLIGALATL
jgi:hypothetical protein